MNESLASLANSSTAEGVDGIQITQLPCCVLADHAGLVGEGSNQTLQRGQKVLAHGLASPVIQKDLSPEILKLEG